MPTASIAQPSVPEGGTVEVVVSDFGTSAVDSVNVTLASVAEDYTEWAFSGPAVVELRDNDCVISLDTAPLACGVYLLAELRFTGPRQPSPIILGVQDIGENIFEVRAEEVGRSATELAMFYKHLLQQREERLLRGFGEGPNAYWALVFIKDCLITRPMRLRGYEIAPAPSVNQQDEIEVVERFLAGHNVGLSGLTEEISEQIRQSRPAVVVHFPRINASDFDDATTLVEYESDRLAALMSLQRSAYPTVFAHIIVDPVAGSVRCLWSHEVYTGNLLGGFPSGEEPVVIRRRLEALRGNPPALLYLKLLREAMRERDSEFKCFRFWNLLETIARSKDYIGQPMLDWVGNVVKNRKGQDRVMVERSSAEELVSQLLCRVLPTRGLNDATWSASLEQGSLTQQVPLWYRRRNCVTHGGKCLCRNPRLPLTEAQYVNCKKARDEVTAPGRADYYLMTLRDVAVAVVSAELD